MKYLGGGHYYWKVPRDPIIMSCWCGARDPRDTQRLCDLEPGHDGRHSYGIIETGPAALEGWVAVSLKSPLLTNMARKGKHFPKVLMGGRCAA